MSDPVCSRFSLSAPYGSFVFLLLFQNRKDGKFYDGFVRIQEFRVNVVIGRNLSAWAKKLDMPHRLWYGKIFNKIIN
jgi:hypothetical protein